MVLTKNSNNKSPEYQLKISVNLTKILKKQFRLVEALRYYDITNLSGFDIPESWINRSNALKHLNIISSTYSIKLLKEVKFEYVTISK
ncbi:MAG: hypothetical protein AB8V22_10190 [Arsenophonus endosymbiont of Dermacentor nuttalli]